MTPILATLFDSTYASKGIALIRSFQEHHAGGFRLFVLALDDTTERVVGALGDERVTVIPLGQMLTPELSRLKQERTNEEFCWTLTASLLQYCFDEFFLDSIAYVDADVWVTHPLDSLYREVRNASIAITPHRFSHARARTHGVNGTYNVGWVYFKNDTTARACLDEWANLCANWCYRRSEQDAAGNWRFGDQGFFGQLVPKYGIHSVNNIGTNLAPWNFENYEYEIGAGAKAGESQRLFVIERDAAGGVVRIDTANIFHFHSLQEKGGRVIKRSDYPIPPIIARHIYEPYEALLREIGKKL